METTEQGWSSAVVGRFSLQSGVSKQMGKLFSSLPLFQKSLLPSVDLVLIEAALVAKRLKGFRDTLFTRDDIPMTADKYFEFIPMIWVAGNHKNGQILSADVIWEMVLLSLCNYQVDEHVVLSFARIVDFEMPILEPLQRLAYNGGSDLSDTAAEAVTHYRDSVKKRKTNRGKANNFQNGLPGQSAVAQSFESLCRFIQHVTQHWITSCSKSSVTKDGTQFVNRARAYTDWVRTTASDDTSCPFSFFIFTALISERGRICFEGAQASYFSRSLCRQLATMCRQYNDYGSAAISTALISPEFQSHTNRADGSAKSNGSDVPVVRPEDGNVASPARAASNEQESGEKEATASESASAKEDLMAIAEFERSCMQLALEKLTRISPPATVHKLQTFVDVTDMFGQIHVHHRAPESFEIDTLW